MTTIGELSQEQIEILLNTGVTFVETTTTTIAPLNTSSIRIYFADMSAPIPGDARIVLNVVINGNIKQYDLSATQLGIDVKPLFVTALYAVSRIDGSKFELVSGSLP
jgi:hypothetical protein